MISASPFGFYECFMNTRSPEVPAAGIHGVTGLPGGAEGGRRHRLGAEPPAPVDTAPQTTPETVSSAISASRQAILRRSAPRLRQTPFRRRLPRFHRAKASHRPPLALQYRDLELLRTVAEYRLITTPQILKIFSDDSRDGLYRRLQRLFHHGYLDRLGTNPNAPMLYAIARRGADVLGVSAARGVGDRYVAHQLMVNDVRIALDHASRAHGVELAWLPVVDGQPVRPDGYFSLRFQDLPDGRNRAFLFLEADRSTMTRERFVEKLRAYASWHDAGGHTRTLGVKTFRVLTVTRSKERVASLVTAARSSAALAAMRGHFWFTSSTLFTTRQFSSIFGAIWERPDRPGELLSLLP